MGGFIYSCNAYVDCKNDSKFNGAGLDTSNSNGPYNKHFSCYEC